MRFSQQTKARDSPGLRKSMPLCLAHRPKFQIVNDPLKQSAQQRQVGKRRGRAPMSFNDPLDSVHA